MVEQSTNNPLLWWVWQREVDGYQVTTYYDCVTSESTEERQRIEDDNGT